MGFVGENAHRGLIKEGDKAVSFGHLCGLVPVDLHTRHAVITGLHYSILGKSLQDQGKLSLLTGLQSLLDGSTT